MAKLSAPCPACDAPPNVYCRKLVDGRWVPFRPRHIHKVRSPVRRSVNEPRLVWEKQSFMHYTAIVPGAGACIEVVRSGRARLVNNRWHPVVFGNRYAGPHDGFETVVEAMVYAETTARGYARVVLELLR